jgi:hypothetical protein
VLYSAAPQWSLLGLLLLLSANSLKSVLTL